MLDEINECGGDGAILRDGCGGGAVALNKSATSCEPYERRKGSRYAMLMNKNID